MTPEELQKCVQRMTQSIKPLTMAAIFVAGTVIAAYGHGGATGIVKERMDGMMAMGKALSVVADMFKGKTGFDGVKIGDAAKIVRAHAAEIDGLFPDTEASRKGKGTEALPAVWDKRSDFTAIAVELEKRAAELEVISVSGDQNAIRVGFAAMAKTCSACHADYRKKKQ